MVSCSRSWYVNHVFSNYGILLPNVGKVFTVNYAKMNKYLPKHLKKGPFGSFTPDELTLWWRQKCRFWTRLEETKHKPVWNTNSCFQSECVKTMCQDCMKFWIRKTREMRNKSTSQSSIGLSGFYTIRAHHWTDELFMEISPVIQSSNVVKPVEWSKTMISKNRIFNIIQKNSRHHSLSFPMEKCDTRQQVEVSYFWSSFQRLRTS